MRNRYLIIAGILCVATSNAQAQSLDTLEQMFGLAGPYLARDQGECAWIQSQFAGLERNLAIYRELMLGARIDIDGTPLQSVGSGDFVFEEHRTQPDRVRVRIAVPANATVPSMGQVAAIHFQYTFLDWNNLASAQSADIYSMPAFCGRVAAAALTNGILELRLVAISEGSGGERSRTFQDMRDSDAVSLVASDRGLNTTADSTASVRASIKQDNESDWDFIQRLASRNGFRLWFANGVIFRSGGFEPAPAPTSEAGAGSRGLVVYTRDWQDLRISDVASEIASELSLCPNMERSDTIFPRIQQTGERSLDFLYRIARAAGDEVRLVRGCGSRTNQHSLVYSTGSSYDLTNGQNATSEILKVIDLSTVRQRAGYYAVNANVSGGSTRYVRVEVRDPTISQLDSGTIQVPANVTVPVLLPIDTAIQDRVNTLLSQLSANAGTNAAAQFLGAEALRHRSSIALAFSQGGEAQLALLEPEPATELSSYRSYAYSNPSISPGQYKAVYVYCDAGDVATGGSTYISPSYGETLYDWPLTEYDSARRKYVTRGWAGYFHNTHATASTGGYVYLSCLDADSGADRPYVYRNYGYSNPSISPGQYKAVYVYCDAGDVATGGSTYISPSYGETLYDWPLTEYDSARRKYVTRGWAGYFHNTHKTTSTGGYVYLSCLDTDSGADRPYVYRNYGYSNPSISPGQYKAVYVYCDAGDVATGGSTYISPSYGEALYDWPLTEYDSASRKYVTRGWGAYFHNTHTTTSVGGYVYVACGDNEP